MNTVIWIFPRILTPERVTQVLIRVEYSGQWTGYYGDNSGARAWSGNGSQTVTLSRMETSGNWTIFAMVSRIGQDLLRLTITKTDGPVLDDASIAPGTSGWASVSYTFP